MKEYRNYIFDLYGTLIDIHTNESRKSFWENFALLLKGHGISYQPAELQKWYHRFCQAETEKRKEKSGKKQVEIDIANVFTALAGFKGVTLNEQDVIMIARSFRIFSTDHIRLFPDVIDVLKTLRHNGRKICLLSNAQKLFTEMEMESFDLKRYFDAIFYSSDHGIKKPDPCFLELLINEEKLDRQESVMIGNDYYDDIMPACDSGLDSFYINSPQSRRFTDSLPFNCTRISRLSDIIKLQ